MGDTPTVVYIHGGGSQPPDDRKFLEALDGWIDLRGRAPSRLACYDHIRPTFQGAGAIEAAREPNLSAEEAAAILADAVEPAPGYRLPANARDIAREYLAERFKCLKSGLLQLDLVTLRAIWVAASEAEMDTVGYLLFGWADRMRAPVAATIAAIDGPLVVVAHSLGSIIGHDVLSTRLTRDVWLFLGVGSPLGNPLVRTRLAGRLLCRNRVARPVRSWVNAYDEHDYVPCVHPKVADVFHPCARVRDLDPPVDNRATNHHELDAYLKIQAVRDVLTAGLAPPAD